MAKYSRMWSQFASPNSINLPKRSEEISGENSDYPYQKNAYHGQRIAGQYLIAYTVEKARSLQNLFQGRLLAEKAQNENAYIGIAVHQASSLRFIKELTVAVTLIDEKEAVIGRYHHVYRQYPGLPHYGRNWIIPQDGFYTIQVQIDTFDMKWECVIGGNFKPALVEVEFPHIMITTGRQIG